MFRFFFIISSIFIFGCTPTNRPNPSPISENWNNTIPANWNIHCTLEFVLDRSQNLKTSLTSEFEGTRDNTNGIDQFRFKKFIEPAYTLISYKTGFPPFSPAVLHTDVRTQVVSENDYDKSVSVAQKVLSQFEQEFGKEKNQQNNEKIVFVMDEGTFQFQRESGGGVHSIKQEIKTRYFYRKKEEPPVDFNPNIFPVLEKALLLLTETPFKSKKLKTILALEEGYQWTVEQEDLFQRIADTAIAANPKLSFVLNRYHKQKVSFQWKVTQKNDEILTSEAEIEPFPISLKNYTFELKTFTRKATFHRRQNCLLSDKIEILFEGKESPQRIRIVLSMDKN